MEDRTAASVGGGEGGRHSLSDSGPSPGKRLAVNAATVGHKRSVSGSILSRLSFFRTHSDLNPSSLDEHEPSPPETESNASPKRGSAMASAMQQTKTRKRKGSLRKRAILGTGKSRVEAQERRNSTSGQRRHSSELQPWSPKPNRMQHTTFPEPEQPIGESVSRDDHEHEAVKLGESFSRRDYESEAVDVGERPNNSDLSRQDCVPDEDLIQDGAMLERLSVVPSALSLKSDASSTAAPSMDEISFALGPVTKSSNAAPSVEHHSSSGSESSLPTISTSIPRTRSLKKPISPAVALAVDLAVADDDWDYSETEWWGWFILIATWIVFVVGMGSCLGVWSWAWDVGETPYAPPELEDDATLPIVGYYPALMILTCVMAWVWVFVAWVGMKYFKHSKMQGED